MRRVLDELERLERTLLAVARRRPPDERRAKSFVEPYTRATKHKCTIVMTRQATLSGFRWERLDDIGRQVSIDDRRETMTVALPQITLTFRSPGAAKDQIYIAFDGFGAGLVNATDTLGRLMNVCFDLGLGERQASILAVLEKCQGSPLGRVRDTRDGIGWLRRLRDLRGRCQHADLEDVLVNRSAVFGRSAEPCIAAEFDWSEPPGERPITKYAEVAVERAAMLFCDCASIIIEHRQSAASAV